MAINLPKMKINPAYNYKELKNSTIVKILSQKKVQKDYSHCEKCVFNNYSCTHILLVFRVIRSFKENFNRNIKIPKHTCCSENMVYMINSDSGLAGNFYRSIVRVDDGLDEAQTDAKPSL